MSNEPYERSLDIFRDSEADEDFRTGSGVLSPDPTTGTGTANYPHAGDGQHDLTGSSNDPADNPAASPANVGGVAGSGTASASAGSGTGAKEAAGHAVEKAADVAGSAAEKAGELKDVALDRGGDVAAVAKDELARLAHEARTEVQSLWSNASEQLRGQAATGQQQLSGLLHSLAGELGAMASKSDNTGPLTALAKQASAKGGEWSHWLANSEPADVLTQVRHFARRRPFIFLASAALAGVVVGRLGRGLMAAGDSEPTPTRMVGNSPTSVPATAGVTTPAVVTFEEVPSFGSGEAPEQGEGYASQATSANPYGLDDGSAR